MKNLSDLSKEQYDLIVNSNAKINIATGPVRSGKNFAENIRMYSYINNEPKTFENSMLVFAGTNKESIYRNFLKDLFLMFGSNVSYSEHLGKGKFKTKHGVREFYSFSFKDNDSFQSLRGATLGGAMLTEGTLCNRKFFDELLARLSIENSKLFVDTNPDSPYHWLYTDFITDKEKRKKEVKVFEFNFDSNLSLSDDYKNSLKVLYKEGSLLYNRMINGLWCMADGIIYESFTENNIVETIPNSFDKVSIGVDYGTANPCVFLLVGKNGNKYYEIAEYYHDGRKDGQKTDSEYCLDLCEFIKKHGYKVDNIVIDPSALSFKTELAQNKLFRSLNIKVIDANNSVLEGIRHVSSLFNKNELFIYKECKNSIRECSSYVWDANAQKRGEDKPLKQNDHVKDAERYVLFTLKTSEIDRRNMYLEYRTDFAKELSL